MTLARLALALLALLVFGTRAAGQCPGPNCHTISGSISDDTTGPLLSGHTYVGSGHITVPTGKTLTIQPGAVIKMSAGAFSVLGTLSAQGTAGQPIVFTSYRDDSAGGDTNGDGPSSGSKGDWRGLSFTWGSDGSTISHAEIRDTGSFFHAGIVVAAPVSGLAFDHISFDAGHGYALQYAGGVASLTDSHAADMQGLALIGDLSDLFRLADNTAVDCDTDAIVVSGNSVLWGQRTYGPANLPNGTGSVLCQGNVTVETIGSLTLEPGFVLKFAAGRKLEAKGPFVTQGLALDPVVITSEHDHAYGGVTGSGTPAPGDWLGVTIQASAPTSGLQGTLLRYGGGANHPLLVANAGILVDGCAFEHSDSFGMNGPGSPTVTDCSFVGNALTPFAALGVDDLANLSGNTASGNLGGDVLTLSGPVNASATLTAASAFNGTGTFLMAGEVTVGGSAVLTIDAGVTIKSEGPRLSVAGQLVCAGTSGAPVVFTSWFDDTWGGDTNADGGATTPAAGDWGGLSLYGSTASVLDHVRVRYGGAGVSALVGTANQDTILRDCILEHGTTPALDANGRAPLLERCRFDHCAGDGPVVGLDLEALDGLVDCTATGNALTDSIRIGASTLSGVAVTVGVANTLNADGVLLVDDTLVVNAGASLTLQEDLTLKLGQDVRLEWRGDVVANGLPGQEVLITSQDDDTGGDSDGSGGAFTTGTPGSWDSLDILGTSGVQLEHTIVRNAGANGAAAIDTFGSHVRFDHVTVEDCAGVGMAPQGGDHVVTNSAFDRCARPIDGARLFQLGGFSGNTATGNALGDVIRVTGMGGAPPGGSVVDAQNTLNGDGALFLDASLTLDPGALLTVGPGVVFKFAQPQHLVQVSGTLDVNGTAAEPVIFTSIHDDDFGGPDADGTLPAPGDWTGLFFSTADTSVLDHVIIRYAGAGGAPSVECSNSANITLCNVLIERGAGDGLRTNTTSVPTLKNVDIEDNAGDAIDGLTWPLLGQMTGVSATGNGGQLDATVIDSDYVLGHVVIERDNVFGACIVVNVTPNVNLGNTLTIGRGVVVKAGAPDVAMPVQAVLGTGLEKTVFTSIHDDEHGGDTNGDGGATVPLPGDWIGLQAPGGVVEHALVRYAGAVVGSEPAPGLDGGLSVLSTRVEHGAGDGVDAEAGAGACENVVAFANGGIGIQAGLALNCTAARNGGVGIFATRVLYSISWHNGPTLTENYYETTGPIIGCPPCQCDVMYSLGTDLDLSGPVQGAPGQFGCPSTGYGNADVDPLFVDELGGDLRLSANSPARNADLPPIAQFLLDDPDICTPWGLTGALWPDAPPSSRDHGENPRRVDDTLTGPLAKKADLGAHERVLWTLDVDGSTELGELFTLTVNGPPGTAFHLLGLPVEPADDAFLVNWNWLMVDPDIFFTIAVVPVGSPLPLAMPLDPGLHDIVLSFQAAVTPTINPALHDTTNVFEARFHL